MTGRMGVSFNGYQVTVQHIPEFRKKPCLMVKVPNDNILYKVASFNSEETADWFLSHMQKMFGKKEE